MKEVSLKDLLESVDAQLPKVQAADPRGAFAEIPPGVYQAVLAGSRAGTYTRNGTTNGYVSVSWRILGSIEHGDRYNGRQYGWFIPLTEPEDLARYKGLVEAWGLPEAHKDSVREFLADTENPRQYVEKYGALPAIEFRLAPGRKGSGKTFPNFIRRLESEAEAGLHDTPAEAQEEPEEPEEADLTIPEPEEIGGLSQERLEEFLENLGAPAPDDPELLKAAALVASQILVDEEPSWTKEVVQYFQTAFNVTGSTAKAKAEIYRIINEAVD